MIFSNQKIKTNLILTVNKIINKNNTITDEIAKRKICLKCSFIFFNIIFVINFYRGLKIVLFIYSR